MDLFKKLTRREAVKKVGTIPLVALMPPPVWRANRAGNNCPESPTQEIFPILVQEYH